MSSSAGFKDFVLDSLDSTQSGFIFSARKMFGEYCIYMSDSISKPKPCFLICNDRLFVKMHKELSELLKNNEQAKPFNKAKLWYVLDSENNIVLEEVIRILAKILYPC